MTHSSTQEPGRNWRSPLAGPWGTLCSVDAGGMCRRVKDTSLLGALSKSLKEKQKEEE